MSASAGIRGFTENAEPGQLAGRVKESALDAGADVVGIAPVERWDRDVPEGHRPVDVLPGARLLAANIILNPRYGLLYYSACVTILDLPGDPMLEQDACPHPNRDKYIYRDGAIRDKLKMQEWGEYTSHLSDWERSNTLDC